MQNTIWYYMLTKDEDFVERIIDRYHELRESWLSDEYLDELHRRDHRLSGAAPSSETFEVWGYSFERIPASAAGRSVTRTAMRRRWSSSRTSVSERGAWMDEHIDTLRQYGHPSKNKKYQPLSPEEEARIS